MSFYSKRLSIGYPLVKDQTRSQTLLVSGPEPKNHGWKIIPELKPAKLETHGYPIPKRTIAILTHTVHL